MRLLNKLLTRLKTCWDNSLDDDIGPLRDYQCPRCLREWKDQWGGDHPEDAPVIYYCPECCKEFHISAACWTSENYMLARTHGFVLKIKSPDVGLFETLEGRFL